MTVTDEDFNQILKQHGKVLVEGFVESANPESYSPIGIALVQREGQEGTEVAITPIPPNVDFNDPDDKRRVLRAMGKQFAEESVEVGCFHLISEAWVKHMNDEDPELDKPVRDYDDKVENIVVAGRTNDGRNNIMTYITKRNDENEIVEVTQHMTNEYDPQDSDSAYESDLILAFYDGYADGGGKFH